MKLLVFISYTRRDLPFAQSVHTVLLKHNIEAWIDLKQIQAGSYWSIETQAAIQACQYFVVIASRYSVKSSSVEKEFLEAKRLGKTIVPVVLDDMGTQAKFAEYQWIDGRVSFQKSMTQLLTKVDLSGSARKLPPELSIDGLVAIVEAFGSRDSIRLPSQIRGGPVKLLSQTTPYVVKLLSLFFLANVWLFTSLIAVLVIMLFWTEPGKPRLLQFSPVVAILLAWWLIIDLAYAGILIAIYKRAITFFKLVLYVMGLPLLSMVFLIGGLQVLQPTNLDIDAVLTTLLWVNVPQFILIFDPSIRRWLPAWSTSWL